MNTSRIRNAPVAKKISVAARVAISYGLGSMKTMAPDAPTSHTIARCSASTPGAALIDGRDSSAVAAYAITDSQFDNGRRHLRHCEERSDEAIHLSVMPHYGLLRCARNDVVGAEPWRESSPEPEQRLQEIAHRLARFDGCGRVAADMRVELDAGVVVGKRHL